MGKRFYLRLALRNLYKNRRVYLPYLLSAIGVIAMFYIMSVMGPSIQEDEMLGGRTMGTVMNLGTGVIGFFAVLFLFYTNSFIIKRRKKELGLYNILGMEKRHVAKMLFFETLLTAGAALGLGLFFGILFSKTMFLLLGRILAVDVPIAFIIPPFSVLLTAALFLAVFFVTMLYNILQVQLANPIELLHGGDAGEKEPKAHWLLAVLGVISLGAGYFMALTIKDPVAAISWFFIAVLLVIAGTYLLFITGITAFLKILKKNKNYYYKPQHFTTVSGMLYRMKQNAAGLASICILFTCLLVTVSSTFALYTGIDGIIRERYPRNVVIDAYDANETAKAMFRDLVDEECGKMGLTPENIYDWEYTSYAVSRTGNLFSFSDKENADYAILEMFTLEEFNRNTGRSVTLGENDILLYDPRGDLSDFGTVAFQLPEDETWEFRIIQADYEFEDGSTSVNLYDTFYMVFRDKETIGRLFWPDEPNAAEQISLDFVYGFDVDATRETIAQLADALEQAIGDTFPAEGAHFEAASVEDVGSNFQSFFSLYGGIFFLGLFLGALFLLGTALIIYYKQVSEGYEDAKRFHIMQKVGMSQDEVRKSIRSQVLTVFFLPLVTAVVHLAVAFPMLQKILMLLNLANTLRILLSCLGCVVVFGVVYAIIYLITARTYYRIVETWTE